MTKIYPADAPVKAKPKRRFCFFCCCAKENEEPQHRDELFIKNPIRPVEDSVNPLRDTTHLLGFTDESHRPTTAFMVIQAIKKGDDYSTPILYASPHAEGLLRAERLVGLNLTDFIDDPSFSNLRFVGSFFEKHLKVDKNASSFLSKGLHGLRSFSVKLLNEERARLNFKFNYTIGKDPKTQAPIFYMIVHMPTQLEISHSKSYSFADLAEVAMPDVVLSL